MTEKIKKSGLKERHLWILIIFILVAAIVFLSLTIISISKKYSNEGNIESALQAENQKQKAQLTESAQLYKTQTETLSNQIEDLKKQLEEQKNFADMLVAGNYVSLQEFDISDLQKKGLSSPEEDIIADLSAHTELIPFKAVLGGKMFFSAVQILSDKWVAATFEDGHIVGFMILKYKVSDSGKISWSVIDAYLK